MSGQHAVKAPVIFKVQLVYADRNGRCFARERARLAQPDDAVTRARHELDLGRFLAATVGPASSAPVTAQVVKHGRVLWELTAAEREQERQAPQLSLGQNVGRGLLESEGKPARTRPRLRLRQPRQQSQ